MLSGSDVAELAQGIERLGYDMLWYPKESAMKPYNYSGFVLVGTDRLRAAAGKLLSISLSRSTNAGPAG